MGVNHRRRTSVLILAALMVALPVVAQARPALSNSPSAGLPNLVAPSAPIGLPPVRHVWEIVLENENESRTFGTPSLDPYLASVLPSEGALLPNFYAIGHSSLDNYIAMISGQAPDPEDQDDCSTSGYIPFVAAATDINGQVVGQGCEFPTATPIGQPIVTLPQQLTEAGYSWKGYMQDMGDDVANDGATACAHPTTDQLTGGLPNPQGEDGSSNFAVKHDPFAYFASIIDDPQCARHVVGLDPSLEHDLASTATTPNFSYITPDLVWDGHDTGPAVTDLFLRKVIPMITASPAFRQDGLVVVTYDESGGDTSSCCHELPGPNSPVPGEAPLSGGGRIGAVALSPFIRPGTVDMTPYNHYSLLRTVEDLFRFGTDTSVSNTDSAGHLGFAGTYADYPGPGDLGCALWTAHPSCGRTPTPDVLTATFTNAGSPIGPRAAGSPGVPSPVTWSGPTGPANDLTAIACPTHVTCLAVGATGTVLASANIGASWTVVPTGTIDNFTSIACPSATTCIAVGRAGDVVTLTLDGGVWNVAASHAGLADLNGISCPSASRCVAVGAGSVDVTADGGLHWTTVSISLPTPGPGATNDLLGVSCPSAIWCVAVGSLANTDPDRAASAGSAYDNVAVSSDGGATWSLQAAGSRRLRAVACATLDHCTAVGESGALWSTSNGTSWTPATAPPTPVGVSSLRGSRDLLDGVTCAAPSLCLVVGARPTIGDELSNYTSLGAVQATALAVTPSSVQLEQTSTTAALRGVACPKIGLCLAVGDRGVIARSIAGRWSVVTGGDDRALTSVSCAPESAPASACMIVGGTSTAFGATEGALSIIGTATRGGPLRAWAEHLLAAPPGAHLNAVSCLASGCVGVGDGGLIARGGALSQEGGADLHGVSCVGDVCMAVGQDGAVLASSDAGASWRGVHSPTSADLLSVSCPSATTCAAVGAFGSVVMFAGPRWSASLVTAPTTVALTGVACPSPSSCEAVGSDGMILSITGAGVVAQSSGVGDQLNAISCTPGGAVCVADGSAGTVLLTGNGGQTWTTVGSGTALDLVGVACPSPTTCLEVGESGAVLSTQV